MKKLRTFLLMGLLIVGAQAASANSNIKLGLWEGSEFTIQIDGMAFNHYGANFQSPNLSPGYHSLVIRERRNQYGGNQYNRIVYNGQIETRAFAETLARLTRARRLYIDAFRPIYNGGGHGGNGHGNAGGQGHGNGHGNGHGGGHANGNHAGCYTLDNHNFGYILNDLDFACYEYEKVQIIRNATSGYELSTKQVKRLLSRLNREDSKLQLAKELYTQTYDPWDYRRLESLFCYNYSKREFRRWLACQH